MVVSGGRGTSYCNDRPGNEPGGGSAGARPHARILGVQVPFSSLISSF
jgi:hypothetical protein